MEETLTERPAHRPAGSWIYWPACAAGMLLVAAGVLGPEADRRIGVQRQVSALQAEVDALARTRDQLATIEKALTDDPAYLERTVRHELGLVRPGEIRLPLHIRPNGAAPQPPGADADGRELPTPLEVVALFSNPRLRLAALAAGAALVAVGIVFSLPERRAVPG